MAKKRTVCLMVLLILSGLALNPAGTALAQSNIQVQANRAELNFPNAITFILEAKSTSSIEKITLDYGTNARTCVKGTARQQIEVTPKTTVSASWEWDFKDTTAGSLPPGAEVWWQWNITDQAGNQLKTERQTLIVEDNRLKWQTVENEQAKIVWSEGGRSFGLEMLDIATRSLDRLETQAGIRPSGQVRLTVFPDYQTFRDAGLFISEWAGGIAFREYNTTMFGLPAGDAEPWLNEVIPHELAHLVADTLVFNCLGVTMPHWLEEGIATYAEGEASLKSPEEVLKALEAGSLPPLRNLATSFSANQREANLSYAQSGEIIRYLVDTYGPEKINDLLAAMKSGKTIDPALQQVYSLDTESLDNAWRESLGFAGISSGQSTGPTQAAQRTAVPTLALWTPAFGQSESGPDPTTTETPCDTSTPCGVTEASLASPTPETASQLAETPEATATPENASPIRCLGINLLVSLGLGSLSFYLYLIRRIYN